MRPNLDVCERDLPDLDLFLGELARASAEQAIGSHHPLPRVAMNGEIVTISIQEEV